MVVVNLNNLGEVRSIIFLDPRSNYGDLYMFHHKIYVIKISRSSNFNPISITLWYENNIIIIFLSIIMDSDKRGIVSATIAIFIYSVLSNTANDQCDQVFFLSERQIIVVKSPKIANL